MSTEGLSIPGISVGTRPARASTGRSAESVRDRMRRWPRPKGLPIAIDAVAIMLAALDVWLVIPHQAQTYSIVLSGVACLALLARRWFPFGTLLVVVPGFFAGWSQLAAMIALGMLATRRQLHWKVIVGAALVWVCRFVQWPLSEFAAMSWQEHVRNAIYGVIVAGMPVALGLLIRARATLANKLAELATVRDRERALHADAVRAEERARLAREMHDVVSHDITLIAMQAGILAHAANGPDAAERGRATAKVIRELSTHTLEELRSLVGVLRSGAGAENDGPQHRITDLPQLLHTADMPVRFSVGEVPETLPSQVSTAAYRTVQECLTNVHKHAPGASATVRIGYEAGTLRVEVLNGRSRRTEEPALPSGGHGLIGLAERARLLGGNLETATTHDGGFAVRAHYPIAG